MGRPPPAFAHPDDSLIAATALAHRLAVVTRNFADFEKAGCGVVNPFGD